MIETELKAMLTPEQYDDILAAFRWEHTTEQTNTYYADTDGILRANHITFRIRTIDGTHKIQVKHHKKSDKSLQICEETEYPITVVPDRFSAADTQKYTGIAVVADKLGSLTTLRRTITLGDCEICLDRSEYLGKVDYELELEYTDARPTDLEEQFAEIGVDFTRRAKGKMSRFSQRLSELNQ